MHRVELVLHSAIDGTHSAIDGTHSAIDGTPTRHVVDLDLREIPRGHRLHQMAGADPRSANSATVAKFSKSISAHFQWKNSSLYQFRCIAKILQLKSADLKRKLRDKHSHILPPHLAHSLSLSISLSLYLSLSLSLSPNTAASLVKVRCPRLFTLRKLTFCWPFFVHVCVFCARLCAFGCVYVLVGVCVRLRLRVCAMARIRTICWGTWTVPLPRRRRSTRR